MSDQTIGANAWLRCGVLLALVFLLAIYLAGGTMRILLHPDLLIWQWVSAGVLFVFSTVQVFNGRLVTQRMPLWVLLVFLVPVALAIAAPPTMLGADVLDRHGYTTVGRVDPSAILGRDVEWLIGDTILIDDDNFFEAMTTLQRYPREFRGYQLEMIGFTIPGRGLPDDQTLLARLLVSCHVGCAIPEGIVAQHAGLAALPDDMWVSVHGELRLATGDDGEQLVLDVVGYTELETKPDPYVFIR